MNNYSNVHNILDCCVEQSQQDGGTSQMVHQEGQGGEHADQQAGMLV